MKTTQPQHITQLQRRDRAAGALHTFESILESTENYTIETVIQFIKDINQKGCLRDLSDNLDLQGILKVALNVPRVRNMTGKRSTSTADRNMGESEANRLLMKYDHPHKGKIDYATSKRIREKNLKTKAAIKFVDINEDEDKI